MHVIITGASRGIGLATARALQQRLPGDLRLSISGRDQEALGAAKRELEAASNKEIFAERSDVSDEAAVQRFVTQATAIHGPVDVLVNNAGFGSFVPVTEMTTETFDAVIATNLRGPFLMTKQVIGSMVERGSGVVITVSSVAGKQGYRNAGAYCAAKHGVSGLMQSLAAEARERGVRVTNVYPGNVETSFFERAGMKQPPPKMLRAEDVAAMIVQVIELPAGASVQEILIRPT